MTVIGVFALQGNVREHLAMLAKVGVEGRPVRRPSELAEVDGLVLPGGESTTMDKLARSFELFEPLQKRIADGMPVFGTCAGMIMLANEITGGIEGQETLGGLDVTVRRNAFGRQVDSFEANLTFAAFDAPYHAVFIRAPWVERVGREVEVLSTVSSGPDAGWDRVGPEAERSRIVAVRHDRLLATSFHPELTGDARLHGYFADLVRDH
ncbi:pyridoxal 5'-phosphate synthase glutaminase subunit PdxT [Kribbella sp. VKM Ac-2568]|uniref:pyridoxal 5'-phosphate synthase glutaminase subunit PdxT n=1 Tax=Kribbella sp. VKM Ac-2568 TaxID=2512219 RepID=UPI00104558BA|nr:pyridoxal 5'-phosphate synthase glutaminase subunit PdxT [Kribbella sp. VKM Ac-2568]TCM44339.1 5'-phosphate synthase pdxT subunit [Kribbella sp. VKM Ac-2568]